MTSRARSKAYQPILVEVHRFTVAGTGIIVLPWQADPLDTIHLPFKNKVVLLQHVNQTGWFVEPYDPAELSNEAKANVIMMPNVIAWVQKWKLQSLADEGFSVPLMTPPTPMAAVKVRQ